MFTTYTKKLPTMTPMSGHHPSFPRSEATPILWQGSSTFLSLVPFQASPAQFVLRGITYIVFSGLISAGGGNQEDWAIFGSLVKFWLNLRNGPGRAALSETGAKEACKEWDIKN